ncbi:MAG: OmpH family outer membrane protein [Verrucomicrobiia bacterium]|jgi:Skp family chaperone for outer membrane proteins|tara:strand:- start:1259 stop:1837 length:579 start_codon:yes stop_codon:yes gene_type:complete
MQKTLIALLLATAILMPARASAGVEQKMATVNVEKTLKDYWRTAVEEKRLKKAVEDVEKRIAGENKKQTERLTELQNMQKVLQNPNLNQAAHARHRQQFEVKKKAFEQNATTLNNWKASQNKDLSEKQRKAYAKIREEIQAVISAQAKKNGFTVVIDSKALLFSDATLDITNQVLAQLNVNDPGKVVAPKKK